MRAPLWPSGASGALCRPLARPSRRRSQQHIGPAPRCAPEAHTQALLCRGPYSLGSIDRKAGASGGAATWHAACSLAIPRELPVASRALARSVGSGNTGMLPNNFAVSGCICCLSFVWLPISRAARPQQRVYAVISVGCNLLTGRASWRSAGGRGGSHAAPVKHRQGLLRSLVGGVPLLPRCVRLHAFNQRACKPCLCLQAMLVRHTGGRQGCLFTLAGETVPL